MAPLTLYAMTHTRTFCRLMFALGVAIFAGSLGGCDIFKGDHLSNSGNSLSSMAWRSEPASLRIYPSSRFFNEGGQELLEARVELIDSMGDSVKASGEFKIELFAVSPTNSQTAGDRLYAWDISMQSLADQKRFYDSISRTYVFRLKLDGPVDSVKGAILRAGVVAYGGDRISAEAVIKPNP